jgi:hypothetical protein
MRRRGGWDEPLVVEANSAAGSAASPPRPEPVAAVPEMAPPPSGESAEAKKE